MICKNCGVDNKEHALFCSGCGQKLKNICPNCNYENEEGSKFCIKCGTRLDETSKKTKTKNVNSSINTNNVLNLITKILKITSFSLCLILILLTIGASFTNILSGGIEVADDQADLTAGIGVVVLPFPTLIKEAMELFVLTDPTPELTHGIGNGKVRVIQMGKVGFEVGLDDKLRLFFIFIHYNMLFSCFFVLQI